jgi:hypothetical protein
MKTKLILQLFLSAILLTTAFNQSYAQEIQFEGNVENDLMGEGISYLVINVTEGPLKGKKIEAYFRTGMSDTTQSINNSELGAGMPIDMLIDGRSDVLIVSGTLVFTGADFEDPETGNLKRYNVYRIKEINQLFPPMYYEDTDPSAFLEQSRGNVINNWTGTYTNSQGATLNLTPSTKDNGPNIVVVDFKLVLKKEGFCVNQDGELILMEGQEKPLNDAELPIQFVKTATGMSVTYSPMFFGKECLFEFDSEFMKK